MAMPAAPCGQAPQQPGLPPLAVSQIEDGRRSEAMNQTLSLSFAEPISIRELLLLLVRDTNLSVVLDPDVDGTFSGDLKNVTLRQALDLVLEPHGFTATFHDNIVRVRREQVQTRLFNINYVATRRSGTRGTGLSGHVRPGRLRHVGRRDGRRGRGGLRRRLPGGTGGIGGSQASVSGTDSGDVFEELQAGVRDAALRRRAPEHRPQGGPAPGDRLSRATSTGSRSTSRPTKPARSARCGSSRRSSRWSCARSSRPASTGRSSSRTPATRWRSPSAWRRRAGPGRSRSGVNIKDFKGLLEAFASQGNVNVMASPWVMAMNNEPAVMRVGTQDVFFVTTSQVDASSGQVLQTVVTPQTINEGVTLSVTPQIAADGIINMSIMPSITERTGTATSRLGDQVPIVSVRETDTLVRVHEGETIVIAGLMQDRTSVDKSKVPMLGDVPLVGGLFRREERTKRKTDLVILLTPTVMTRDEIAASASADEQRLYEAQRKPVRK